MTLKFLSGVSRILMNLLKDVVRWQKATKKNKKSQTKRNWKDGVQRAMTKKKIKRK